jgi:hypothetical protein
MLYAILYIPGMAAFAAAAYVSSFMVPPSASDRDLTDITHETAKKLAVRTAFYHHTKKQPKYNPPS